MSTPRDTVRGMRRVSNVPQAVATLLAALAGGCALLTGQGRIDTADGCIRKNCYGETDAIGYQRCEASCRSTYGR